MKTLQKWLLEANVEAVIGTILYENPINLTMLEEKGRSVAEILDTAKTRLCNLIKYLLSLTAVQLEYSQHCLKREAAKVRRLLVSEYNNQSFCSEI